jgi:hypothetical protein
MLRRRPLAASDIPSRQPKYGASAWQVCVRLRRPLGEGRGTSQCRAPNPDAGIFFGSCEKREGRLVLDRAHRGVSALGDGAIPIRLA